MTTIATVATTGPVGSTAIASRVHRFLTVHDPLAFLTGPPVEALVGDGLNGARFAIDTEVMPADWHTQLAAHFDDVVACGHAITVAYAYTDPCPPPGREHDPVANADAAAIEVSLSYPPGAPTVGSRARLTIAQPLLAFHDGAWWFDTTARVHLEATIAVAPFTLASAELPGQDPWTAVAATLWLYDGVTWRLHADVTSWLRAQDAADGRVTGQLVTGSLWDATRAAAVLLADPDADTAALFTGADSGDLPDLDLVLDHDPHQVPTLPAARAADPGEEPAPAPGPADRGRLLPWQARTVVWGGYAVAAALMAYQLLTR